MFKITFELGSPISFTTRPTFDAILAYAYVHDMLGYVPQFLNISESGVLKFENLPIKRHEKGYFLASYMQYDESIAIESIEKWKKRWANKYDYLADFGKGKKRSISIQSGEFKSYDVPFPIIDIPEVWFYFDSDNIAEIDRLIDNYVSHIGKKRSQGFGYIKSKKLEIIDYNPFENDIIRPIPFEFIDKEKFPNVELDFTAWKPPYWNSCNFELCAIGVLK